MAHLRVVPFQGALRPYFELGLVVPRSCGLVVEVIYGDRTAVCKKEMLCQTLDVNVETLLKKATVLATVQRYAMTLRSQLPDYQDVSAVPVLRELCIRCVHL